MDISQITQFGVAGLSVFLMYRISANHIDHNTAVLSEVKDAINKLTEFLQKMRENNNIASAAAAIATESRFNRSQTATERRFKRSQMAAESRFKRNQKRKRRKN